jgi:ATP-binding cassette subfamily B protein
MGHPRRVYPLIGWTVLEYLLRGVPYGVLLLVVWELFRPLESPGSPLNVRSIVYCCVGLLIASVFLYLVSRKAYFAAYRDSYMICADGRISIVEHLRRLSMGFFNARDPGDIGAYIVSDYGNIETLISHLLPQTCGALAAPLILLAGLAFVDWRLTVAAALVIPLALPLSWVSGKIVTRAGRKHQKSKVESSSRMIEYIQGIRLIRAFNLGGNRFERLEKAFRTLKSDSIRLEAGAGPTIVFASFVLNAGFTLIILLGLDRLLAVDLPLAVYIMFLILGTRIFEPLIHALTFMAEINYMKLGVDRVESLRRTAPLPDGKGDITIDGFSIELRKVTFRYHSTEVVKEVSLSIPARSLTALVGPSGSGKTTLTRLIARFWDVDDGQVLIGGRDIKEFRADRLLSHISIVFQDVYLFNDTIYNNIRMGRPEATRDQVIAASIAARCHEFIDAMPEKYDTIVGEGGSTLSGGEKQRISIARAILKDAPIILLDEATASLDPENEIYIQQAITSLIKDQTVIIIAHRLNTVSRADKIVVLDKGRVIEEGTHETLLAGKGLYRLLWDEQQRTKGWKF